MVHLENVNAQTLVTTAETQILAIPFQAIGVNEFANEPNTGNAPVPTVITGIVNITPGAAATQIVVKVRQAVAGGGLTGTVLEIAGGEADDVTAAVPVEIQFEAFDATGNVLGWIVTAAQVTATGNGTVNFISADDNPQ